MTHELCGTYFIHGRKYNSRVSTGRKSLSTEA